MMWIWIAVLVAALVAYAFARPYLRRLPSCKPFYNAVEPVESWLFLKSRTVLVARLQWVPGLILSLHDLVLPYFGLLDWDPITAKLIAPLLANVPPEQQPAVVSMVLLAVSTVSGSLMEWLRCHTDTALEDKE